MNRIIHTVGHSNHELENFLLLLQGADVVCDVRSHPASRHCPHFCRQPLAAALKETGRDYVWMGRELGGRGNCRMADGRMDYRAAARQPEFRAGIQKTLDLAEERRPVLMCSEHDPMTCHRALLVCRALRDAGADIRHILADGRIETHAQMEERLMDMYERPPLLAAADDLERAYDWLARRIAHRQPLPA